MGGGNDEKIKSKTEQYWLHIADKNQHQWLQPPAGGGTDERHCVELLGLRGGGVTEWRIACHIILKSSPSFLLLKPKVSLCYEVPKMMKKILQNSFHFRQ